MKFLSVILVLLIIVPLQSCKKAKENKLIGEWKLLPKTAADREDTIIFHFKNDQTLYIYKDGLCDDTGSYNIKSEFFKYYVVINNLKHQNANYYIEKIKKDILILQSYSPYIRKEFVRNE